jgi:tetratricopeptide (TPR) repeat protein
MNEESAIDPITMLRERLERNPEDLNALTALIRLLAGSANERELSALVEKAVSLSPLDVHTANAVLVASSKSDAVFAKAVSSYESQTDKAPIVKVNLANLLSLKADDQPVLSRMRALVDEALAAHPRSYEGHLAAHTVYGAQGDLSGSLRHLEEAVGLAPANDPKLPTLVLALGARLADAGKHADSIRLLSEAVRAYGRSPTVGSSVVHIAYTTIGLILLAEGNKEAALDALNRSRSVCVDPVLKSTGLRTELARQLAAAGFQNQAKEVLDLAEKVKGLPVGTWLGKRASVAYLDQISRAASLPLTTLLFGIAGWMIARLLLRAGLSVVAWEFALGFILLGYGLLVLRGALSKRFAMSRNQRRGYFLAGMGFLLGGALLALIGWVQGLVALVVLLGWGIITLAKARVLSDAAGGR